MGVRVQILAFFQDHHGTIARVQVLEGQFAGRVGYIGLINLT